ncbi:MAG: helicase [Planctomycetes bacterium]|nr:helicase [Planctomycetota bacterium]
MTSLDVRQSLVEALQLDLVGPWHGHDLANEQLEGWRRPSNWYLTGFLIPSGTPPERSADDDADEGLDEILETGSSEDESNEERKAAKKGFFPSSMGLSFLVGKATKELTVTVRWGDYTLYESEDPRDRKDIAWVREPREEVLRVRLEGKEHPVAQDIPRSDGLQLHWVERALEGKELDGHLPPGTRSVALFLVNHREPTVGEDQQADSAYVFQPEVSVACVEGFVARPDLRGCQGQDWDDQVADLHYSDTPEYASGHGVSATWDVIDGKCHGVRTVWMSSAEVEKTETADLGLDLSMDRLGELESGQAVRAALEPVVERYRAWIEERRAEVPGRWNEDRAEVAVELLRLAGRAAKRIEDGIDILVRDEVARDAFRVANRAVARALRKRLGIERPAWRAFQLAFLLLNLEGIADPKHPDRRTVDLLFFPTGGGKTEAYLGLAAFAIILRRLRHSGVSGAGVSVIMRYTLRLLTLDQLGRAAGLVCALELERERDPERYGQWPFEIGLWVGKAATPNLLGRKGDKRPDTARSKLKHYQSDPRGRPSPIPLENCPWCGAAFTPDSFQLLPDRDRPRELRITCSDYECEFASDRALPIIAVDDVLYRRLPAFLIATVDKFASLPWVAASGLLLGGAERHDENGFYGPADPGMGRLLEEPLKPPDLVIQDELHLIAGPLGTMAGLYETAIEDLCRREVAGRAILPKIVASTATVRRAQDQIQALFGRASTMVFPPPGPDRRDSFFAQTLPAASKPARLYLGVSAQGRNPKVALRKTWLALMGAAERRYREAGGEKNANNPADPYMTVLGYFNSLRELGGARRILEEQVQNTLREYGKRKRLNEDLGLFRNRTRFREVVELTSRVSTNKVAEAKRRLETPFQDMQQRVDCAIATNMISVGLDIPRLGLMVVLGQPKTTAEYIQATSRVGRRDEFPGLVVTIFNVHRPRDRSHYERFRHYHETFYRTVEVSSVTPFSARALDRGFAGAAIALARHSDPRLTPPAGVSQIVAARAEVERRVLEAFLDRLREQPIQDEGDRDERLRSVQNRLVDLLDAWRTLYEEQAKVGAALQYQKYELKDVPYLLQEMLTKFEVDDLRRKFRVNRSLRDVEPHVELFLKDFDGRDVPEKP